MLPFLLLLAACGGTRKRVSEKGLTPTRRQIITDAQAQLGRPYKWGGCTSAGGFDCSGLVQFVYSKRGIVLPRTTAGLATAGKEVSIKNLRPADLLLFRGSNVSGPVGHVGIVLRAAGEETEFLHASTSKGVIVSSLSQEYYEKRFVKAINVIKE